jgi:hypothetical protein
MSTIDQKTPETDRQALENEKLRCEIERIKLEIKNSERRWRMELILKAGALLGSFTGAIIAWLCQQVFSCGG